MFWPVLPPATWAEKRGSWPDYAILRSGVSGCCVVGAARLGRDFGANYGCAANLAQAFGNISSSSPFFSLFPEQ